MGYFKNSYNVVYEESVFPLTLPSEPYNFSGLWTKYIILNLYIYINDFLFD